MPPPTETSTALCGIATPIIRSRVRRVAARLGLRLEDREDLEQELWLLLWLWWSDAAHRRPHNDPSPLWLRYDVTNRVDRLLALLMRSGSFWRRTRPRAEQSASHWLSEGIPGDPTGNVQRCRELSLDVAAVLPRLSNDVRAWCESVLRDDRTSATLSTSIPPRLSDADLAALRRALHAQGLHEYL